MRANRVTLPRVCFFLVGSQPFFLISQFSIVIFFLFSFVRVLAGELLRSHANVFRKQPISLLKGLESIMLLTDTVKTGAS